MKKTNLGGSFEKMKSQLNSDLLKEIYSKLSSLKGSDILSYSIRNGAEVHLVETIKFVKSCFNMNSKMTLRIVGTETIDLIKQWK